MAAIYCSAIHSSKTSEDEIPALVKALCDLLLEANSTDLLSKCSQKLTMTPLVTENLLQLAKESPVYSAALVLGIGGAEDKKLWIDVFVDRALSGPAFAPPEQVHLCSSLLSFVTQEEWDSTVASVIGLKLRANPERVLPTVTAVTQYLAKNLDVSQHLEGDTQLLTTLLKQLKSAKESTRTMSRDILVALAALQPLGAATPRIASSVAESLKTMLQSDHRQVAYQTLFEIGSSIPKKDASLEASVASTVLASLAAALGKENKTAVSARECGLEAMLSWMAVAKRNNGGEKGYDAALAFLRKPLEMANGPDIVQRMSPLFELHPDLQESLVLDLCSDAKVTKGLEKIVDNATKKHNANSSVASLEGLIAVHLAVVNAIGSGTNKMPASVSKILAAGSSVQSKSSFLYASPLTEAVRSNTLVSQLLPRTIALYVKLAAKKDDEDASDLLVHKKKDRVTAAANAFACAVAHPSSMPGANTTETILSNVQTMLVYQPKAADALVEALMARVNTISLEHENLVDSLNASREAREAFAPYQDAASHNKITLVKGKCSQSDAHYGLDPNAVRRVASRLEGSTTACVTKAWILMHLGTSQSTLVTQRKALIRTILSSMNKRVLDLMEKDDSIVKAMADEISLLASVQQRDEEGSLVSESLHRSALSLLSTLGGIACSFDPTLDDADDDDMKAHVVARQLCVDELAVRLATNLKSSLAKVEALSEEKVALFKSPMGSLFGEATGDGDSGSNAAAKKGAGKGRRSDEEEWERQVKEELEQKKKTKSLSAQTLSPEQKKKVAEQDMERQKLSLLLFGDYTRVLSAIRTLALSDIEVGNSCLPALGQSTVRAAVSKCTALSAITRISKSSEEALGTLATCVYEIDEDLSPSIARVLSICCSFVEGAKDSNSYELKVSALPSPCGAAASVIEDMDNFGDTLSGASFAFVFPILRAALTGPRSPQGCEAALRLVEIHSTMLTGEDVDADVKPLRKDMVSSVLELLAHDRSQTFANPTPFEALVSCYSTEPDGEGPALSTAELAPLLNDQGALGSKNCRVGSMIALKAIAQDHRKLVKNNPLAENRIWMSCFDQSDAIKIAAREAWRTVTDDESESSELKPPSVMYAIPLLPLMTHSDAAIASAAASANAAAMGHHLSSVERNILKLCTTYIESFPTGFDDEKSAKSAPAMPKALPSKKPATAAPKKKIATGLPKKKTVKKDALAITGIGKSKSGIGRAKTAKKKTIDKSLLKPKEERTFDQDLLANQFKTDKKSVPAEKDSPEKTAIRQGMLRAISATTNASASVELQLATLKLLTGFLVAYGLGDGDDDVRSQARNALRDVVATKGSSDEAISFLLPSFEKVLSTGDADDDCMGSLPKEKVPRNVAAKNRRKEGAVVALGSVALHLKGEENETKISTTVDMLISALSTPSESVQSSVAECLAKLMKKGRTKERVDDLLKKLLRDCLYGDNSQIRRGAAYGISAVVKGSGIVSLKKFSVVQRLEDACETGSPTNKEGSLFAMELLSARLGLLFEPYVIVLLPSLLKSFSDGSDYVRSAATTTADLIMSKLSAHGVKLIMPAVLTAFNDPAWRTKQASIHMLGSMSHCAPKQLASALPKVVPKLMEAFGDTHPKVKQSADDALKEISKVVKNPEISSITRVLLNALTDPADGTLGALEALIATEFLHAIDAPSLALIVPILHRGLRDRVATTKRYGALIAGNICTMINDPKDFIPYLPILLPDLQLSMLDPIPDVRSTSAKAVGSLARGLGEDTLPDLRTWLVEKLRDSGVTSAERSGAAQGLTELLVAGGASVVDDVMREEILPLRQHPQAATREGVLWVLSFMPTALGQSFSPLIDVSLPALLGGLSDENEPVRDVAMRAGRVLIRSHGKANVDKILPNLEDGLLDDDYRIRVASLTLLGDLLSLIGGTSVIKGDGETQDDVRKAERAQAQIALVLGSDTRKRVLSGLYLARSDTAAVVRQSAIQVWKTVVSVTARTLRDILKVLVGKIVDALASGDPERTQVAGRCLGDIVNKLGDSVLPEIIPVLRNALYTGDKHTRTGVCVGLTEVISCSTRDQILRFIEIIVKAVQDALCDEDAGVRKMAASCFQSLHNAVGSRAMDEIVPSLLVALEFGGEKDQSRQRALNGLTGILAIRSRELLPYIIPRLITRPMTKNHGEALAAVAHVTGSTIHMHFHAIIPALISELGSMLGADDNDPEIEEAVRQAARAVCGSVDEDGVNWLVSEIANKCGSDKQEIRKESCWMFQILAEESKCEPMMSLCHVNDAQNSKTRRDCPDVVRVRFYNEISV